MCPLEAVHFDTTNKAWHKKTMPFEISLISISSEKRVQGLQVLNFETHEFDFLPATDLENLGKQS